MIVAPEGFVIVNKAYPSAFVGHIACNTAVCDVKDMTTQADLNAFANAHECAS